jgi:hypothetical protein
MDAGASDQRSDRVRIVRLSLGPRPDTRRAGHPTHGGCLVRPGQEQHRVWPYRAVKGLADHVVSGFFDGRDERSIIRQRVADNEDGTGGNVDIDGGYAGELADFCPHGPGTVVAGHSGHFKRAGVHDCE